MAQRSVAYNDLASSIDIVTGDYTKRRRCTPWGYTTQWYAIRPMGKLGHGECSVDAPHALARFEICADFSEICQSAQMAADKHGTFFLYPPNHPADGAAGYSAP